LPLYAIGSALLLQQVLDHRFKIARALATAACALAPLWGLGLALLHPHEVLARTDVARANDYFAQQDRNSFVITNLLADAPIVAAFGRHSWTAFHERNALDAQRGMLDLFERTGTTYVHAIIFTTPESRFIARSISQVSRPPSPSVDGWPYLLSAKVEARITAYDKKILRTLETLGAKRVLQLGNFDIYRIDRNDTLEASAATLPVVQRIDFDSLEAARHLVSGWGPPDEPAEPRAVSSSILGYGRCRNPLAPTTTPAPGGCSVIPALKGLEIIDVGWLRRARLMVRLDRACDQQLTITLGAPAHVEVGVNDAVVLDCNDPNWATSVATVRIPSEQVHVGINIISFDDRQSGTKQPKPDIKSVVIEPRCQ
jgi:hypothetical protein